MDTIRILKLQKLSASFFGKCNSFRISFLLVLAFLLPFKTFAMCEWDFDEKQTYDFEVISVTPLKCNCRMVVLPWKWTYGCVVELKEKTMKNQFALKFYTTRTDACNANPGQTIVGRAEEGVCNDAGEDFWPILYPCGTDDNLNTCIADKDLNRFY